MHDPRATLLIIEDEPEIRRFLRASLSAEGYRVVEATSGRRGAIDAETHKPDLVIIGFPSAVAAREWYASPAYQDILELRSEHSDS